MHRNALFSCFAPLQESREPSLALSRWISFFGRNNLTHPPRHGKDQTRPANAPSPSLFLSLSNHFDRCDPALNALGHPQILLRPPLKESSSCLRCPHCAFSFPTVAVAENRNANRNSIIVPWEMNCSPLFPWSHVDCYTSSSRCTDLVSWLLIHGPLRPENPPTTSTSIGAPLCTLSSAPKTHLCTPAETVSHTDSTVSRAQPKMKIEQQHLSKRSLL